jgi:uncharacterized Zn finger protein
MSKMWARLSRNEFDPAVQGRGRAYFQSRRVNLESLEADTAKFKVIGTLPYQVELLQNTQDSKLNWNCTCSSFNSKTPCKHIWAAILFSDENEIFERPAKGLENKALPSWRAGLVTAEQRLRSLSKLEEVSGAQSSRTIEVLRRFCIGF